MNARCTTRWTQMMVALLVCACSDGTGTDGGSPNADVNILPNDFVLKATMPNGGACSDIVAIIPVGSKDTLTANFAGSNWTWTSQNPSIVSVQGNGFVGVVTAHALGQACISVGSTGGFAQGTVQVVAPAVTTISVAPSTATVPVSGTRQFTATAYEQQGNPMTGVSFSWSSSNGSIATVNSSGLATGVSPGQATITASASGKNGTATLNVTNPLTVNISGPQNIALYQSAQYTASVSGGTTPYTYEWRSRDGSPSGWGSFTSWYSTGTTNYTYASISACGLDRKELQVRVTDAQSFTNTAPYYIFITNPC